MGATFEQLQSAQQLLKRWRQGEAQAPRSMAKNVAKNGTTPWKTMENHGKPWKNHGKPWKTMEKPWKCSYGKYIFIETLSGARETKPEFQQKKTSIFAEHEFG
jgi:hypothetical protein